MAHRLINHHAVFLLPPSMIGFYKRHISYLSEHATDPDKRRYAIKEEAPRHYIDMDKYGQSRPPENWNEAMFRYGEDSLLQHGILPWWIEKMRWRLIRAFREKDGHAIVKLSADIGHYISDGHVPLHACSNHNGQFTGQQGIHGFWESRIPEKFAEAEFDFIIGQAAYLRNPSAFIWKRILQSAAASDTVLHIEKELSKEMAADLKYAYENRNGKVIRQYSSVYTAAYHRRLNGMVERRMRHSIDAVASFWYTAWVDAGQPEIGDIPLKEPSSAEKAELDQLDLIWKQNAIFGRACEGP